MASLKEAWQTPSGEWPSPLRQPQSRGGTTAQRRTGGCAAKTRRRPCRAGQPLTSVPHEFRCPHLLLGVGAGAMTDHSGCSLETRLGAGGEWSGEGGGCRGPVGARGPLVGRGHEWKWGCTRRRGVRRLGTHPTLQLFVYLIFAVLLLFRGNLVYNVLDPLFLLKTSIVCSSSFYFLLNTAVTMKFSTFTKPVSKILSAVNLLKLIP